VTGWTYEIIDDCGTMRAFGTAAAGDITHHGDDCARAAAELMSAGLVPAVTQYLPEDRMGWQLRVWVGADGSRPQRAPDVTVPVA